MAIKLPADGGKQVDAYLRKQQPENRQALQDLRAQLLQLLPGGVEVVSYGVPMIKYKGRPFLSYGVAKNHCSFYVQNPAIVAAHQIEIGDFKSSGGTIHFTPEKPLPAKLIKLMVTERLQQFATIKPR